MQIHVPRDLWDCFVYEEDGKKKLYAGWADIIRDEIRRQNPACSFAFKRSWFVKKPSLAHFWKTTGYCKHKHCADVSVEAQRSSLITDYVVFDFM